MNLNLNTINEEKQQHLTVKDKTVSKDREISPRGPIVSILKKPQMGKDQFQIKGSRNTKGFVATLEKMNKYQRAGHILEKLRNDTE